MSDRTNDTLVVEHSGDGTVVRGTSQDDIATTKLLCGEGFRWSRRLEAWYLPRSWKEPTRRLRVTRLQAALGDRLRTEQGDVAKSTTAEQRAQERQAQLERSAARNETRATGAMRECERRFDEVDRISAGIPTGQPILVGHHSEGRHRRDLDRISESMSRGTSAARIAREAEERAASARRRLDAGENPITTERRIARNEAEVRKLTRLIDGSGREEFGQHKPASGDHSEQLEARRQELVEDIERDQQQATTARAERGIKTFFKDSVHAGDQVQIRGQWYEVKRANTKTVTIASIAGGPWTYRAPWSLVTDHRPGRS